MALKPFILSAVVLSTAVWQTPSVAAMTETSHYVYSGGRLRDYLVNKPTSCTTNCAVVIDMHGYSSSANGEKLSSGQRAMGDANGYIVVYPEGVSNSWNAGSSTNGSCCGYAESAKIDDVGFIKTMIAKIKRDFPMVDPSRIYATGISNGCAMSQRLAVEASDVIAAASCTSLYLLTNATTLKRPISVTEIHGFEDELVSYEQSYAWTGAQRNFKRWARLNSCVGDPVKTQINANSYVEEFSNCSKGVKVKLYSIRSGHITYSNPDNLNIASFVWDNLKNFRLP